MDFSKFGKKVQAAAATTAKIAGEQMQKAKLQIDKTSVTKDITDAFAALGKYCYLNYDKEDELLPKIMEYKKDIDELKLKLAAIEKEIEEVGEKDNDIFEAECEEQTETLTFNKEEEN